MRPSVKRFEVTVWSEYSETCTIEGESLTRESAEETVFLHEDDRPLDVAVSEGRTYWGDTLEVEVKEVS